MEHKGSDDTMLRRRYGPNYLRSKKGDRECQQRGRVPKVTSSSGQSSELSYLRVQEDPPDNAFILIAPSLSLSSSRLSFLSNIFGTVPVHFSALLSSVFFIASLSWMLL